MDVAVAEPSSTLDAATGPTPRSRKNALHLAAEQGQVETLRELLLASSDGALPISVVPQRRPSRAPPGSAYRAVARSPLRATSAQIDAADNFGDTALHLASRRGHTDCVRLLLLAGANVELRNVVGRTPAEEAAAPGHGRPKLSAVGHSVASLLNLEPEVLLSDAVRDAAVQDLAMALSGPSRDELAFKALDGKGTTILHLAVECSDSLRLLCRGDGDRFDGVPSDAALMRNRVLGDTPLHVALRTSASAIEELLAFGMQRQVLGAMLLAKNLQGETALHLAVSTNRRVAVVRQLLDAARSAEISAQFVDAQNISGDTALHLTVRLHSPNIGCLLLNEGQADCCLANKAGHSSVALACSPPLIGLTGQDGERLAAPLKALFPEAFRHADILDRCAAFMLRGEDDNDAARTTGAQERGVDGGSGVRVLYEALETRARSYEDGNNVLHLAAIYDSLTALERLQGRVFETDSSSDGVSSPTRTAVGVGHADSNMRFLRCSRNHEGQTPLALAKALACDDDMLALLRA